LRSLFPNVQFFITTHSPTVVSNFNEGSLFTIDNGEIEMIHRKYYGKEVNDVLVQILGAHDRPRMIKDKI
jgi:predicted ATP-binding protein involved in virulence